MADKKTTLNSVRDVYIDEERTFPINVNVYGAYTYALTIKYKGVTAATVANGGIHITVTSGSQDAYVALTAAQQNAIMNAVNDTRRGKVEYVLTTLKDGVSIGTSSVEGYVVFGEQSYPEFDASDATLSDSTHAADITANGEYLQNVSNLIIGNLTAAQGVNGAEIVKYEIKTAEGMRYFTEITGGKINFGVLRVSGTYPVSISAIDSRGLGRTYTFATITVKNFAATTIENAVINRTDATTAGLNNNATLTINGTYTPVDVSEDSDFVFYAEVGYRIKTFTSVFNTYTYIDVPLQTSGNNYLFNGVLLNGTTPIVFNETTSYDIVINIYSVAYNPSFEDEISLAESTTKLSLESYNRIVSITEDEIRIRASLTVTSPSLSKISVFRASVIYTAPVTLTAAQNITLDDDSTAAYSSEGIIYCELGATIGAAHTANEKISLCTVADGYRGSAAHAKPLSVIISRNNSILTGVIACAYMNTSANGDIRMFADTALQAGDKVYISGFWHI